MIRNSLLICGQYMFQFFAFTVALICYFTLLHRIFTTNLRNQISQCFLVNIYFWISTCTFGIVHSAYMKKFGLIATEYSSSTLFWTATFHYSCLSAVSITVIFLLLERLRFLHLSANYANRLRLFVLTQIGCASTVVLIIFVVVPIIELPLPEITDCSSYGCILTKTSGLFNVIPKAVCGITNVILALLFIRKMALQRRQHVALKRTGKRANEIAKLAAATEFVFNVVPTTLWLIFSAVGIQQWNFLGAYGPTMFSVDGLATVLIYTFLIRRKWPKTNVLSVTIVRSINF
ncbi:hypothetical protein M3Y98_00085000 [Aphelenchoides besseyi]|nr:hypothetical protein M3Y98_00085000 [Aphelenchoides besseyi]